MSRDIWVISDTHLSHENFLKFTDSSGELIRPFKDIYEMDDYMLEKWNSVVKPGDLVYHLGDVFFGDKDRFKSLWPKFHGSKRLLVGNHDDIKFLSSGGFFQKVYLWRVWPEYKMVFSHIPLHPSNTKIFLKEGDYEEGDCGSEKKHLLNVHGHIHQNDSPEGNYFNVSVERLDYTPIHIEELAKKGL